MLGLMEHLIGLSRLHPDQLILHRDTGYLSSTSYRFELEELLSICFILFESLFGMLPYIIHTNKGENFQNVRKSLEYEK